MKDCVFTMVASIFRHSSDAMTVRINMSICIVFLIFGVQSFHHNFLVKIVRPFFGLKNMPRIFYFQFKDNITNQILVCIVGAGHGAQKDINSR